MRAAKKFERVLVFLYATTSCVGKAFLSAYGMLLSRKCNRLQQENERAREGVSVCERESKKTCSCSCRKAKKKLY